MSTPEPYTPSLGEIIVPWIDERVEAGVFTIDEGNAQANRALAAHDREVAEKAELRGFNRGYAQANRENREGNRQ